MRIGEATIKIIYLWNPPPLHPNKKAQLTSTLITMLTTFVLDMTPSTPLSR